MSDIATVNKEKLIADMKVVMADADELLRVTAGQAGDKMADLRAKLQTNMANARASLAEAQAVAIDKAKQVGRAADDYVHENPWRSVGVAAGIAFIAGLLIGRR